MKYLVLAYYRFTPLDNPLLEVKKHKNFFKNRDLTGRIYLSEQGINGQMSGLEEDVRSYMSWLQEDPRFKEMFFKIQRHHENTFPRMTVKYRAELAALGCEVDPSQTGRVVSPSEWKRMLENPEENQLLIDVRNSYETEVGHFEGALLPPLENFRDFPAYAEKLKEMADPKKTKLLIYCTAGIRCELYSALLKVKGFTNVYQLEGGIINYGIKEGDAHWKGKVFVFDDRLAVPIDEKEAEPIASCRHCALPSDIHYNCANMDCNELYISCPSCQETYQGCCSHACKQSPRKRPFEREGGNKPFRRKHLIAPAKDAESAEPSPQCCLLKPSDPA